MNVENQAEEEGLEFIELNSVIYDLAPYILDGDLELYDAMVNCDPPTVISSGLYSQLSVHPGYFRNVLRTVDHFSKLPERFAFAGDLSGYREPFKNIQPIAERVTRLHLRFFDLLYAERLYNCIPYGSPESYDLHRRARSLADDWLMGRGAFQAAFDSLALLVETLQLTLSEIDELIAPEAISELSKRLPEFERELEEIYVERALTLV